MTGWAAPLVFFEDEDEAALEARFVELMARHSDRYNAWQIAEEIFKDLREPGRYYQAAMRWSNSIAISERIREAQENAKLLTLEELQLRIIEVTEDRTLTPQEKKVKIDGYMAYASTNGWVTKAIDKKIEDKTRHFPRIVYAQYDDE